MCILVREECYVGGLHAQKGFRGNVISYVRTRMLSYILRWLDEFTGIIITNISFPIYCTKVCLIFPLVCNILVVTLEYLEGYARAVPHLSRDSESRTACDEGSGRQIRDVCNERSVQTT